MPIAPQPPSFTMYDDILKIWRRKHQDSTDKPPQEWIKAMVDQRKEQDANR
jgi:hypothetical protein